MCMNVCLCLFRFACLVLKEVRRGYRLSRSGDTAMSHHMDAGNGSWASAVVSSALHIFPIFPVSLSSVLGSLKFTSCFLCLGFIELLGSVSLIFIWFRKILGIISLSIFLFPCPTLEGLVHVRSRDTTPRHISVLLIPSVFLCSICTIWFLLWLQLHYYFTSNILSSHPVEIWFPSCVYSTYDLNILHVSTLHEYSDRN